MKDAWTLSVGLIGGSLHYFGQDTFGVGVHGLQQALLFAAGRLQEDVGLVRHLRNFCNAFYFLKATEVSRQSGTTVATLYAASAIADKVQWTFATEGT